MARHAQNISLPDSPSLVRENADARNAGDVSRKPGMVQSRPHHAGHGGPGAPAQAQSRAAQDGSALQVSLPQSPRDHVAAGQTRGGDRPAYDEEGVRKAVRLFLQAIGEDPDREGLVETPDRIARAGRELFAGLSASPEQVLEKHFDVDTDELVLVKNIELYSVCEHHLLPFHGVAHVGYIPAKDGVMGLSKLARLVEVYARRPQVQERLTQQIADALVEYAGARGVIVVTECEHLCMSMRGVKKSEARTVTSAVRGLLRNPATRAEAMSLIMSR
ncbi:GTP cyclohydrolase I [Bifidobacterium parmae]|uniref:GTP cyclohydrolase 1 n=1 Tax=Bifidobacterium parmae TaxID=361854 RepID=A0A2N5J6G4_9BIFI|nr:GTP cyclohydrolase I [Bifidobacterium parmae]